MKKAVCCIIKDKNTNLHLSVSRKDNHDDKGFPGGKVDEGEDEITAIVREIFEETGIILLSNQLELIYVEKDSHDYLTTCYYTEISDVIINISDVHETGKVEWITSENFIGSFTDYNKRAFDAINEKVELKQVIVMRSDLNMPKGKLCSQASHASMSFITKNLQIDNNAFILDQNSIEKRWTVNWLDHSFTKITVKVKSEDELLELYQTIKLTNIPVYLITDNGKTMFDGVPTNTCIAIGPAPNSIINLYTSHLSLL